MSHGASTSLPGAGGYGDEPPFGGKILVADTSAWVRASHPRVPLADALIAASAQDAGVDVLHYDHHYDRLAQVLNFESVWIASPGALEKQKTS